MPDDLLYVATDADGRAVTAAGEVRWNLPDGGPAAETVAGEVPLVLYEVAGLIEALEAEIYRAEATGKVLARVDGSLEVAAARLVARTAWDTERAARFAIDCARHALGDNGSVALPDGTTLGTVLENASRFLDAYGEAAEPHLGFLARLAAARRLRRSGEAVADVALVTLSDDTAHALDALDDPTWATLAAVVDAVLAAVETLRHVALPRYVESREEVVEEHSASEPAEPASFIMTPWGPVAAGAEHLSPYVPAWVSARDAAERARDAARDRAGAAGEASERAFQAARLAELLAGPA